MCPISPAAPHAPRTSAPLTIKPPPSPVPSVRHIRCRLSRPAPKRHSPNAATFTSLSTKHGRDVRRATALERRTLRHPGTFTNSYTSPRSTSTGPGAPIPIPLIWAPRMPLVRVKDPTARATRSTKTPGRAASRQAKNSVATTRPVASTNPALTLVPPKSMPTVQPRRIEPS